MTRVRARQSCTPMSTMSAVHCILMCRHAAAVLRSCDAKIALLEAGRELGKTWLHVDMDAFYAG